MREHMGLYIGKRIDNGEWVEGSLLYDREQNEAFIAESFEDRAANIREVDPDTVGECTGLRDKNGKLIFEGDVISIRFESDYEPPSAPDVWYENAKIVFSDKYHAWHAVFGDGYECSLWEYDNCDDVFAIGNIHDNPELLKGGEGE